MRRTVPGGALVLVLVFTLVATALAGPRLTAARYQAIDRELTAEIALDKSTTTAVIAKVERACRQMNQKDRLLKPISAVCLAGAKILRATPAFSTCKGANACQSALNAMRSGTRTLVTRMRTMNTAINRYVSKGPCRTALRATTNEFNEAALVIKSMDSFEKAIKSTKESDAEVARSQLRQAQALAKKDPSAATERRRFRAACR